MPELPEVEGARRQAERHLAGRRIVAVETLPDARVYAGVDPRRFAETMRGRRVLGAGRKGKYLWLELDRRPWPVLHFGMSGSLHFYAAVEDRPGYWKAEFLMEDGLRAAVRNVRRLGRIRLAEDPLAEDPVARLGRDPWTDMPSPTEFSALLRDRRTPVKALLLNQGVLAGIGNWVADEVLYHARIAPGRPCGSLSDGECRELHRCIRRVIRTAVEADADSSRFPPTWLFHHRWGKKPGARTRRGEIIAFDTVGGRTTAWVPDRQR